MIEGDNLEVLKLLQKSYAGKVKMIFIDPPYNKDADVVYNDNFATNLRAHSLTTGQSELGQMLISANESDGRHHTTWLNMIAPRLDLAYQMLRSDGCIFVSLDEIELANCRAVLDSKFGPENLLAIIAWEKVHTRKNSAKGFSKSVDYILAYAKDKALWDRHLIPRDDTSAYSNPDNDPKGPWKRDPITAHNPYDADYRIKLPSGEHLAPPEDRYWAYSEESWLSKVANNEVLWSPSGGYPSIKRYLSEVQDGLVPVTLFSRKFAGDTSTAKKEVALDFDGQVVFDYPKPTLLIQRLIQISSSERDIILDFFAGSGTTGVAVLKENQARRTFRRFILVQLAEPISAKVPEQAVAAKFCASISVSPTISSITKERLRRAGRKIKKEHPDWDGDTGFRVFKLDSSNHEVWDPDRDDIETSVKAFTDPVKPDRSDADMLYELFLKLGYDLCAPLDAQTIAGLEVQFVAGGQLVVCLAREIDREQAVALGEGIGAYVKSAGVFDKQADQPLAERPEYLTTAVFRDAAFSSNNAKLNLTETLKQAGIESVRSL